MNGKLGSAALTADIYTTVYTVPANTTSTINVAVVNRGDADSTVKLAVTTGVGTPTDADFIEYGAVVPKDGGVLERTAIVVGSNERIVVQANTGSVTVRVHGFENKEA